MNTNLQKMLQDHSLPLWKGAELQTQGAERIPTGFNQLDALFPQNGFTPGTILEIVYPQKGSGELRLLFPALAYYTRQQRYLAWIAPPHIPYSPALALHGIDTRYINIIQPQPNEQQHYWCMEKLLSCPDCGAALFWPKNPNERSIRRLQLAASKTGSLGVLLYSEQTGLSSSPAATRIQLKKVATFCTQVTLLKARGLLRPASTQIKLPL